MNFEKIYGAEKRQDGLYEIGRDKWEAVYGFGRDAEGNGYNYRKQWKGEKPTLSELKNEIYSLINEEVEQRITTGLEFEGVKVWLSKENQMNFKRAYDMAFQNEPKALPVCLKIGENDGGQCFRRFDTFEDIKAFYLAIHFHVQKCLEDGWNEKETVDWSKYELKD